MPLYPKKNIYKENLDKNYSLILVPTAGFEHHNNEYFAYPSNSSIKRLYDAYNFSKNLEIPIFISGGKTKKNIDSEAEILAKNFFENLKNMEIILETKSMNSYDTGYYVNRYLKENNLEKNIILFTDVYHFKRMLGVLEKNNITVFFSKNSSSVGVAAKITGATKAASPVKRRLIAMKVTTPGWFGRVLKNYFSSLTRSPRNFTVPPLPWCWIPKRPLRDCLCITSAMSLPLSHVRMRGPLASTRK